MTFWVQGSNSEDIMGDARSRRSEAGSLVRFGRDCSLFYSQKSLGLAKGGLQEGTWYRKEDL